MGITAAANSITYISDNFDYKKQKMRFTAFTTHYF